MRGDSVFNILFTSAGRRVSLVRHFRQALDSLALQGCIVTADVQKTAPAAHVADFQEQVPPVSDPDYIRRLLEICREYDARLVVPLIDTELLVLATHKAEFEAIGATLLVASPETIEICADKRRTHAFFKKIGADTPEIFDFDEILNSPYTQYPLLLKPAAGSSSISVTKINNERELAFFRDYVPDPIVQEFIAGEEYTLDVLVDFKGIVRTVVPRLRMETRAGEVSKGMTVKHRGIIAAGKKVIQSLPGAVGCITVQCFLTPDGSIKFIEINPRFGGGFPLSYKAGADFPGWIVQMILGKHPRIRIDGWQDGLVMLRYDEGIFVRREKIFDQGNRIRS
jgi:carbamoyl-phosphate synthase large subunit